MPSMEYPFHDLLVVWGNVFGEDMNKEMTVRKIDWRYMEDLVILYVFQINREDMDTRFRGYDSQSNFR